MAKRLGLFLGVNLLIVLTITTVTSLLGIQPYLSDRGINLQALAVFSLIWGFGGAFISLALSRITAKWMMGVQVIDPQTRDPNERWVIDTV
jgi:heat shock protein HtpX